MNPFQMMGNFQGAMDMIGKIRSVMQNPASLADVMMERGAIDRNTYNAVKGMGPQQVGQYMMNNGLMTGQQAQGLYSQVPGIQRML